MTMEFKVTLIGGKKCGHTQYVASLREEVEVMHQPRPDFNLPYNNKDVVSLIRETYRLVDFKLDHVTHNVYIHSSVPTQQGVLKYLADHVQPKYKVGDKVWRATQFKGHEVAQVTCYVVHSVRVGVDGDNKADYVYILRSLCVGSSLVVNSNDVYSDLQGVQQLGNR